MKSILQSLKDNNAHVPILIFGLVISSLLLAESMPVIAWALAITWFFYTGYLVINSDDDVIC